MQNNERIVQLLYRRLKGLPLTVEEDQELETWMARSESNRRILESLSDVEWLKQARKRYYAPGKESGLAQLREQLFTEQPAVRSYSIARRFAFAASIIILIASGIYFFGPTKQASEVTQVALAALDNQLEVLPGGEAILTLSNGLKIPLREQADGLLAQLRNGKQLLKQDGKLVYQSAVAQLTAGEVNYMSDPRSDQYSVVLPDGSRVWLNRGSTLSYPEKFAADKRTVELNGEGYFEIAKAFAANGKDRLPFIVRIPAQSNSSEPCEVEVLGTHFNIYAHKDEPLRTTLTEGKIKMIKGAQSQLLAPGQQAVVENTQPSIAVKDNINVQEVLAWKDYKFSYSNASLHSILRELRRWYGTGFKMPGEIPQTYSFNFDRNKPISEVIDLLNKSGNARITLDGNLITVNP
jgi:transmembrane sensor